MSRLKKVITKPKNKNKAQCLIDSTINPSWRLYFSLMTKIHRCLSTNDKHSLTTGLLYTFLCPWPPREAPRGWKQRFPSLPVPSQLYGEEGPGSETEPQRRRAGSSSCRRLVSPKVPPGKACPNIWNVPQRNITLSTEFWKVSVCVCVCVRASV